jgi:hypothetical protein
MVGFSYLLVLILLFFAFVVCSVAGAAIAYCAAKIQKRRVVGWWKDSVICSAGFFAGLYFGSKIVYPTTISYMLESGVGVTETERFYRHPEYIGYALAFLFPIMFELGRFWIVQRTKIRASTSSTA